MIEMFIGMAVVTVFMAWSAAIFTSKLFPVVIPVIALMWFAGLTQVPNYLGYAIDQNYVLGQEAYVISVEQTQKLIYILAQFPGQPEYRLVKMPATAKNKQNADKAKEQVQKNGLAVIKFGQQAGGGDESGKKGNGGSNGDGDSKSIDSSPADFALLNPEQSQLMKKDK